MRRQAIGYRTNHAETAAQIDVRRHVEVRCKWPGSAQRLENVAPIFAGYRERLVLTVGNARRKSIAAFSPADVDRCGGRSLDQRLRLKLITVAAVALSAP